MKIHLLAVGTRIPAWVQSGYQEYAQRLPRACALHLLEIPAAKRSAKCDIQRLVRDEGQRLLAAAPAASQLIALDERGSAWTTAQLAQQLGNWLQQGRDVSLLIGGADGLDPCCRQRAAQHWSLSALTLPHAVVRIIVAEQLYRAWSLLHNHPYHRP